MIDVARGDVAGGRKDQAPTHASLFGTATSGCASGLIGFGVGKLASNLLKPSVGKILSEHVAAAQKRFLQEGFTRRQLRALVDHPNLEAAFKGERIDTFAKQLVAADSRLSRLSSDISHQRPVAGSMKSAPRSKRRVMMLANGPTTS